VSKLINLEVVGIEDGYAILEMENGHQIDMDLEYLPDNLKEGRFIRFVISHTDYSLDKTDVYEQSGKDVLPNGKLLSY
jgi:hypothetical protein